MKGMEPYNKAAVHCPYLGKVRKVFSASLCVDEHTDKLLCQTCNPRINKCVVFHFVAIGTPLGGKEQQIGQASLAC